MNHEAELAQLLIQMGADRGIDVETILAELSWTQFPSFVDAEAVRASLVDAVESWWRADLESRIDQLRNQFVAPGSEQPQFGASQVYEPAPSYQQAAPAEPVYGYQQAPPVEAAPSYRQAAPVEPTPVVEQAPEPVFEPEPAPQPTPSPVFDSLAPTRSPAQASPMTEMAQFVEPTPAPAMPVPEPVEDATVEGMAVDAPEPPKPPTSMPSDATMIWNTRGG